MAPSLLIQIAVSGGRDSTAETTVVGEKTGVACRADARRSEETIAGKLAVETKSITDEEAPQYLDFLGASAGPGNPTSNDKTAKRWAGLGADPSRLGPERRGGPLLRLGRTCAPDPPIAAVSSSGLRCRLGGLLRRTTRRRRRCSSDTSVGCR